VLALRCEVDATRVLPAFAEPARPRQLDGFSGFADTANYRRSDEWLPPDRLRCGRTPMSAKVAASVSEQCEVPRGSVTTQSRSQTRFDFDYARGVIKVLAGLALVVTACRSPAAPPSNPGASGSSTLPSTNDIDIPSSGPFSLPVAWTSCAVDADCTIVSLGCCDETPVNRDRAVATRTALEKSGRGYCPPKDACGPSSSGTWDGEAGKCDNGRCRVPPWP
jgi:hypothetical protein